MRCDDCVCAVQGRKVASAPRSGKQAPPMQKRQRLDGPSKAVGGKTRAAAAAAAIAPRAQVHQVAASGKTTPAIGKAGAAGRQLGGAFSSSSSESDDESDTSSDDDDGAGGHAAQAAAASGRGNHSSSEDSSDLSDSCDA